MESKTTTPTATKYASFSSTYGIFINNIYRVIVKNNKFSKSKILRRILSDECGIKLEIK
jgi:hypothetical protein